uniref:Uncharacterized protein n=1 Tax=Panagrolaimus sp. ES5 TaxID=591445 RepID=A0AC34FWH9_9BILA
MAFIKGPNFDPHFWSGWVETPACDCPNEEKFAYMYEWKTSTKAASGLVTTTRVLLGIATLGLTEKKIHKKDLTHECVIVRYKCKKCEKEFAIQYEIDEGEDGRLKDYGHFESHLKIRECVNINLSFAFVQECYEKMWGNYKFFGHNCFHWAKDFSYKLRLADSEAFIYGRHG